MILVSSTAAEETQDIMCHDLLSQYYGRSDTSAPHPLCLNPAVWKVSVGGVAPFIEKGLSSLHPIVKASRVGNFLVMVTAMSFSLSLHLFQIPGINYL